MKCKFCGTNEPNKTNTHYLTDFIIRTCLNFDGDNKREKGFFFNVGNENSNIELNIQRNSPVHKIENEIDRLLTQTEIENSKERKFSVDNIFCSDCENRFTEIENQFNGQLLERIRKTNCSITFSKSDQTTLLNFIYLQVFRTAICHKSVNINKKVVEDLRNILFSKREHNTTGKFPILFIKLGMAEKPDYTENLVGIKSDWNSITILFNDFIILFSTSIDLHSFPEFLIHLINYEEFLEYTNHNEPNFNILYKSRSQKRKFYYETIGKPKIIKIIDENVSNFQILYTKLYQQKPSHKRIEEFRKYFTSNLKRKENVYTKFNRDSVINTFIKYFSENGLI